EGLVVGVLVLALALSPALAGCGGGEERQDASEPAGRFPVRIVTSSFPTRQRLAQTSLLRIGVQNTGSKPVPSLAITISLDKNAVHPFSVYDTQPGLADPDRPVWVLENDYPRLAGSNRTAGAETANDKTFDFGTLEPGETVEAVWRVTPVRAGTYTLDYQVDAGLTGKAKAVTADGGPPTGSFVVRISDQPPETRVNDQGEVVVVPSGGGNGQGGNGQGGNGQGDAQGGSG
ncbi:MAG: hypothetical protein ACRDKV_01250, partial [Solirubrobacterales bacterium]